ncbi:tripartite tricarboxylate transporter substrate binding protein [Ramlibacter henchirensis]|uniref:Tripartite tricarboxylate transporter substrate binding protein n=1 Tax=Ramlibacter henchirensis TaxID=204072 RepID=A0A4Z0BVS4_9BURK|nr:tripartite tricarboxylate transporter substrate binding protein [Ramlibacter henchirensis]TFZ02574.1 tripartite tricarboxylate transporter substrate binding protein [Ramlibacter henchirensis]
MRFSSPPSRRQTLALLAGAALAPLTSTARAQAWPARPVTFVVPLPPGGATDALTRKLADKLSKSLGQPVVVENRAGAGGTVGAGYVAKANPDGHTILMGVTGSNAISASVYSKLPFNPAKDFAPVALIVRSPLVLVKRPGLAVNSLADYVAAARAKPEAITYSSPGRGTTLHLAGGMLGIAANMRLMHVPYQGSGPALQAVLAEQVDSMFADLMQVLPMIKAGKLHALAVTSKERHALLPQVPTVAESGFPQYEAISWHALFAPAGTPGPVVEKLHAEVVQALREPDIQEHFAALGLVVDARTPADTQRFVQEETQKWAQVVKATGAALD